MANICTVIITGEAPAVIAELPCVKWFGEKPIQKIDNHDIRKRFGDTIIYTKNVTNVLDILSECGYPANEVYWQDIDGYGETKIFRAKYRKKS